MVFVRLVILDLDMTLVETLPTFYGVFLECLREEGVGVNLSLEQFLALYYSDSFDRGRLGFWFWRGCWLRYTQRGLRGRVYPGVTDALARMRNEGRVLVIATGRELRSEELARELEDYGIASLVDWYISLGDLGPNYEKKDMISHVLSRTGFKPRESAYVSDHPRDIEDGNQLGLLTIGVATYTAKFNTPYVVKSVSEIPGLIREIEEAS